MKHHLLLAACIGYCLGSGCVCYVLGGRLRRESRRMELRERMIRLLGGGC